MKYLVEHMQGTAGINESAIETVEIEATTARAAIELATNDRDGDGWHWDGDTLNNDSAANRLGSYCDYWMATEVAPDLLAEVELLKAEKKELADALAGMIRLHCGDITVPGFDPTTAVRTARAALKKAGG